MAEKILHMEIETNKRGKFTLKFIEWTDVTYGNKGYWTERTLTKEQFNELLKLCYPKWDGKNQISEHCTDDYDWDDSDADSKTLNCSSCPHVNCNRNTKTVFIE